MSRDLLLTADGDGAPAVPAASPSRRRVAQQQRLKRPFALRACLHCDWSKLFTSRNALNNHAKLCHGLFYSAEHRCNVPLRGAEAHVTRQQGHSLTWHSPRSASTGSNTERRKIPRVEPEERMPSRLCRNRRRRRPAPVMPGDRGTRSVTVATGPSTTVRQEAGGSRAAGKAISATEGRPTSPASSTGDDLGPRPQIQLGLEEEGTNDPTLSIYHGIMVWTPAMQGALGRS